MNFHSPAASFAAATEARFSSIPKLTTIFDSGGLPPWICHTGLLTCPATSCVG
jgi:hypothetical protein